MRTTPPFLIGTTLTLSLFFSAFAMAIDVSSVTDSKTVGLLCEVWTDASHCYNEKGDGIGPCEVTTKYSFSFLFDGNDQVTKVIYSISGHYDLYQHPNEENVELARVAHPKGSVREGLSFRGMSQKSLNFYSVDLLDETSSSLLEKRWAMPNVHTISPVAFDAHRRIYLNGCKTIRR
ncbi:MAG: hypothetical protein AB7H97_21305 [Pseudobdellovibrionaceae bacterium]